VFVRAGCGSASRTGTPVGLFDLGAPYFDPSNPDNLGHRKPVDQLASRDGSAIGKSDNKERTKKQNRDLLLKKVLVSKFHSSKLSFLQLP
jgi:hypothetical protein